MARVPLEVEVRAAQAAFQDERHALAAQAVRRRAIATPQAAKDWPAGDVRGGRPGLQRAHRTQPAIARVADTDAPAAAFLVGLAAADGELQPACDILQI